MPRDPEEYPTAMPLQASFQEAGPFPEANSCREALAVRGAAVVEVEELANSFRLFLGLMDVCVECGNIVLLYFNYYSVVMVTAFDFSVQKQLYDSFEIGYIVRTKCAPMFMFNM